MGEIISGGGGRPPRRRVAIAVALALVAVGAGAYLSRRDSGSRHPATSPTVGRHRHSLDLSALGERTGLALYALGGDVDQGGDTLTRVSLDTGRSSAVPGVPQHTRVELFVVPVWGGVAVTGPRCGHCSYARGRFVYVVRGMRVVRRFPVDGRAFPAATGAAVWIQHDDPTRSGALDVREIDLTGRALTRRYLLPGPAGQWTLVRGTVAGLLLSNLSSDRGELWDPATGSVLQRFPRVIAASGTQIAFSPRPCPGCALGLTDLRRDTTRTLTRLPSRPPSAAAAGAFCPDGTSLALVVDARAGAHVVVIGLGTGGTWRLPDTPNYWPSVDWSTDSRWLILTLLPGRSPVPHPTIAVWRPGMPRPALAAHHLPSGDQFVVGGW